MTCLKQCADRHCVEDQCAYINRKQCDELCNKKNVSDCQFFFQLEMLNFSLFYRLEGKYRFFQSNSVKFFFQPFDI